MLGAGTTKHAPLNTPLVKGGMGGFIEYDIMATSLPVMMGSQIRNASACRGSFSSRDVMMTESSPEFTLRT